MTQTTQHRARDELSDRPVSELVRLATEQIAALIRDELRLARTELAEKGRRTGKGIGLLGTGAILAVFGGGALVAAAVLALALVVPAWLAALIVATALFVIAALLALAGRRHLRRAAPAAPTETVSNIRSDVRTVAGAVRDRGQR